MLLTGRKLVSGTTFQTKLMDADVGGRDRLDRAEPGAQPFGHEQQVRLLEPQRARRARRPGRQRCAVQALLRGQHGRPQRQLPHAHRIRDVAERRLVSPRSRTGRASTPTTRCSTSARCRRASTRARPPASPSRCRPPRRRSTPASTGACAGAISSRASARPHPPTARRGARSRARRPAARCSRSATARRSTTAGSATRACSTTRPPTSCTSRRSTPPG